MMPTLESALYLVIAVIALGLLYVVVPVVASTYARLRGTRMVMCPETRGREVISLDATQAAVTAAFGDPVVQVRGCSRWPDRRRCDQSCLAGSADDSAMTAAL
jgi:hypothetical protein